MPHASRVVPRGADAAAEVEEALGVDAAGEADERVDRAEHEDDGERILPEQDADEGAAGGEDELGRGEREDRQDRGQQSLGVGREGDVAGEVDGGGCR